MTPNTTPRRIRSHRQIREHWADELVRLGKFDSRTEALDPDLCMACGFIWSVGRAHILARVDGGSDDLDNVHLLCDACHAASEYINGDAYWAWFKARTILDVVRQLHATFGVSGPAIDLKRAEMSTK